MTDLVTYSRLPQCVRELASARTLERWGERGTFPPSIRPGGSARRWRIADVRTWISQTLSTSEGTR